MSDLAAIISELVANGYTEQGIADALRSSGVDVTQSTINRIKRKALNPRFDIGIALVHLKERAPRPMRSA